jgi:ceramide glucosyltransferase
VVIPPFPIAHACVEASAKQLVAHELRWSRTIRHIDPLGHLGSALIHPLAFALLALALSGGAIWAWLLALVAICARLALQRLTDRALHLESRDTWLLPLWDIVSFAIFIASFLSSRVIWRGFSFKVDGDGLLSAARDE